MRQFKALDTFCKAGGATKGLQRSGFYVVGVDIEDQKHYCGDLFVQGDALEFIRKYGREFDFIWAGPPCQGHTLMNNRYPEQRAKHPRLIVPTRKALGETGKPFVIENVVGAPVHRMVKLCGTMFGLGVVRHRLFESNFVILQPSCQCSGWRGHVGVYGDHPDGGRLWDRADGYVPLRRAASIEEASAAMGIDWMEWSEITQAIPPAYSEFIGRQAIENCARGETQ